MGAAREALPLRTGHQLVQGVAAPVTDEPEARRPGRAGADADPRVGAHGPAGPADRRASAAAPRGRPGQTRSGKPYPASLTADGASAVMRSGTCLRSLCSRVRCAPGRHAALAWIRLTQTASAPDPRSGAL